MQHFRQYGPLDDTPDIVGDGGFTRLDMLTDPALLPPGSLSAAQNIRFDANGTTVRAGLARQFPPGTSIGRIYGVGVYKPDTDDDAFALLTEKALVIFYPQDQTFLTIAYPTGQTIEAGDTVDLAQAAVALGTLPGLYIVRGLQKSTLCYTPGPLNSGAPGYIAAVNAPVTGPPAATGFPNAAFVLFYQDRMAAAVDLLGTGLPQAVAVSDFLGFTNYVTLNQFNIARGGDDYLTGALAYQNDYVLISSRKSWYVAFFDPNVSNGGYSGNLSDSSFLRLLTAEAGAVGPKAAFVALGKIWFITDDAIYAFVPQLDGTLNTLGKPLSADIQPIMDRFSCKYANGACIEHWGYRLYFAMPINDVPVSITAITVTIKTTTGLLLDTTLPALLGQSSVVTVTTATPHLCSAADNVQISGLPVLDYNGEFYVISVVDPYNYVIGISVQDTTAVGNNATSTRLVQRNNTIAVYNLKNEGWESIDTLPPGIHADWLRNADYGTQRRLWVIDAVSGPMLYEESEADEIGTIIGGITLPFTLDVSLQESQFANVPVAGSITTRAMRWVNYFNNPTASAYPRKVKGCEVRATMADTDQVTMNFLVRTPNNTVWNGLRSFVGSQFDTSDAALRKMCGMRGLEAQIQLTSTYGRPNFRSVLVDTVNLGKVEE